MKQQTILFANDPTERKPLSISEPNVDRGIKGFLADLFRRRPLLTFEDWERLETRRSAHSIRAEARREGIL